MIIIYYRNNDGEIVDCHTNKGDKTLEEIRKMADDYNKNEGRIEGRKKYAYIEEVDENSLAAYLYGRYQKQKEFAKENLRYASECIRNALDVVDGIRLF